MARPELAHSFRRGPEKTVTAPKQDRDPVSSYRPRLVPWALGIAIGVAIGIVISVILAMSPAFTVAFMMTGIALGVGFAIALQAAFDDMASKKK
jgi:hypothetical protein